LLSVRILAAIVLIAVAAVSIPRLIPDGTEKLSGESVILGRDAIELATIGCLDHPFAHFFVRRVRLVDLSVEKRANADSPVPIPSESRPPPLRGGLPLPAYSARVHTYTFFGVPSGVITIHAPSRSLLCNP